jgi:UDP-GlcNAc:undecaprenyl-phosphate/decaprenyl-phosphate GlcNAc-1-phosphate transferase
MGFGMDRARLHQCPIARENAPGTGEGNPPMVMSDGTLIAFVVVLLLTFALRPVARAIGLLDHPGGHKEHVGAVPIIGGVCMYLGMLMVLPLIEPPVHGLLPFLTAAGLLVIVGAIDDRFDLPPAVRLLAQCAAGLILCLGAGLMVNGLGDILFVGEIPLGPLALPFTVLVTISVINAYNMLDGMDGLAGGVSLASITLLALASLLSGGGVALGQAMISIAVVLGFLVVNVPVRFNRPVRTFMGDAGSTLLGFTVVWLALQLAHGTQPVMSPVTALWIAALPIFELFISFGRRIAKGQSPLRPDRDHFHHILQRVGLTDWQVLVVMVGSAFLIGLAGILAHRAGAHDGVLFFGLIALGLLQFWAIRRAWRISRWIRARRQRLLDLRRTDVAP